MEPHLPESWWQPDVQHLEGIRSQLTREVGAGHPLAGRRFEVLARCEACDEVLVELDDGSRALVHPTFSTQRERPPWPMTKLTDNHAAADAALAAHAFGHGFDGHEPSA